MYNGLAEGMLVKKVLLGTPNRESQEYSRNIIDDKDPVGTFRFYSYYVLGVPLFGDPSKVLLPVLQLLGHPTHPYSKSWEKAPRGLGLCGVGYMGVMFGYIWDWKIKCTLL